MVVVAGTPGSGKTSVLMHAVSRPAQGRPSPRLSRSTVCGRRMTPDFKRLDVPVIVGFSRDMCPDHYAIYNFEEMFVWTAERGRIFCSTRRPVCVCAVRHILTGPGHLRYRCDHRTQQPLKVGPLLTTADVVVMTKGDLVSQAEREVFRERILEANPGAGSSRPTACQARALQSWPDLIRGWSDISGDGTSAQPAVGSCTLCTGELRTSKEHHRGVVRHLDGFMEYTGE